MVDDWVEGQSLVFEVSLWRLDVVCAKMALNKTFKLPIHNRAMSKSPLLSWKTKTKKRLKAYRPGMVIVKGIQGTKTKSFHAGAQREGCEIRCCFLNYIHILWWCHSSPLHEHLLAADLYNSNELSISAAETENQSTDAFHLHVLFCSSFL